ncbi:nucleotidyltransferase family protein [Acidovorax sp. GBBC 3334]|uniref:nucleotidyltransferase family protein n=1 Tax=Acidovorax sp. GBBC 3334 TaxID=2940496 RepID=UPI0023021908|nr:nucleotidyltransferase family protein [Acidovorax sp. GBBC 3334]MDA8453603.1 nucleotidyltransferase family protein [Acidovorax sp. GBBC 3334]
MPLLPAPSPQPCVAGIVLAAGAATRFGSDKRQAVAVDGEPMLATVAQRFGQVFGRVAVVLPPDDAFGQALCARLGIAAVVNARCHEGQGTSLAAAMQWALAQQDIGAVVVGLADMPWVRTDTLLALRTALAHSAEPALPVFGGRAGNPRGLPRHCFAALAQATGAHAAAQRVDWGRARTVAVDDPGVLRDVDTPADLPIAPL